MDSPFVARDAELAFLAAQLEQARAGRPRIVGIEGPAGMGKSALVRRFLASAGEARVLAASADEAEQALAYGVVEQLVTGAGVSLPAVLDTLVSGGGADPLSVGAGLVELVGGLQAGGVVVVVVDDVQWADAPSLQALVFALRRLRVDRVLALMVFREEAAWRLPEGLTRLLGAEQAARLRLEGLDAAALQTLSAQLGMGRLSLAAAERLRRHTGGSPLHARTLLEELPPNALTRPGTALPAPRSMRMLVLSRLASCPPDARRLVVAATVLGLRCPLGTLQRLAQVEEPLEALEQAIGAGLLEEVDKSTERAVTLPHPLVRAAVYDDLGPATRAELHARAAELVDDEALRLHHLVAAAARPDAELAADVDALARHHAACGAWAAAGNWLVSAAHLSPTRDDRERRLLEATEWLLLAGDMCSALALAPEIVTFAEGSRRHYIQGRLALVSGRQGEAEQLLRSAWELCEPAEQAELAGAIAGQLAGLYLNWGRGEETVTWARRAQEASSGAEATASPRSLLLLALAAVGRADEGLALVASLPEEVTEPGPAEIDALLGRGVLRLWTDDFAGAHQDLAAVTEACRAQGPFHARLIALFYLAETEYRLGRWQDAVVHGELAASGAQDAEQVWTLALAHAAATFPLAGRGDWQAAQAHADSAAEAAQALGDMASVLWAAMAQARLAHARADYQNVVAALHRFTALAGASGVEEPGIQPWRELYAEALVHLGRLEEAAAALAPLEERAAQRRLHSALAGAARVRGLLAAAQGRTDEAEAAFVEGQAHAENTDARFAQAQLEAAYGSLLRRLGRRRAAGERLLSACERFACLGAQPFLDRCQQELAACGLTPVPRAQTYPTQLTPQELAVARLVSAGRTNRQVAAELVVSIKTVEYHLAHVYAKLGIRSRRELPTHLPP